MKTLIPFSILAILSLNIFAQTDTISENIYQYQGNLGIGIANPAHSVNIAYLEYGVYIINIWDNEGLLVASKEIVKL
jgi:acyl-homoserine lactone acylase PvdQ